MKINERMVAVFKAFSKWVIRGCPSRDHPRAAATGKSFIEDKISVVA
jgi:hypothetical protein